MASVLTRKGELVQDPPLVQKLLSDKRAAWIWLLPRLWLAYQWIDAGSHKITNPAWVQTGEALKGFWTNAVASPNGKAIITFDWYRGFIQSMLNAQAYTWFGKLIAFGELAIGVALLLGAFTGIAAFAGGFMNWNYMMAGTASTNPLLFVVSVGLILAWKVGGLVGADFFLLRWLGTPWHSQSGQESPVGYKPATVTASQGAAGK